MKIAILHDSFPPYSVGGADIVAYELAQAMRAEGHEVIAITTSRNRQDVGMSDFKGIRVYTLYSDYHPRWQAYISLWNGPVVREVQKILAEFKPEVVHAHNVHGHLSYRSLKIAKDIGAKVVLTAHDVMSFNYQKLTDFINPNDLQVPTTFNYKVSAWKQFRKNRFRYNPLRNMLIRRRLHKSVDRIVAVSDALKQALNDNGIENVEVIHNGIDTTLWEVAQEKVDAFKQKLGLTNEVVLFGGRLSAIKGGGKLLEALSQVVQTMSKVQLLVIGKDDAYAKKMQSEAAKLGLEGKLVFTGWVEGDELHAAYRASNVVAVPSLCFDSFPTMNLEAFASHVPVIATCFGGSRELVTDNENGYIVNPYDVSMLANRLEALLGDVTLQKRMGDAAYMRVVHDFNINLQSSAYETLFEKVRSAI